MNYNYIIAGGGCAGLSMAWHLLHYGPKGKKTLLIDANLSPANTKTWCFWGKQNIPFIDLAFQTWDQMQFGANGKMINGFIKESPYHCLREADYKRHILDKISNSDSINLLEADIQNIIPSASPVVITDSGTFSAEFVFQSCFPSPGTYTHSRYKLKQHFTGWEIKTQTDRFDPAKPTLMDFNTSQKEGVTFFYTLPFGKQHALIEYTLFTDNQLEKSDYEKALGSYIREKLNLHDDEFELIRSEHGCIPMVENGYRPYFGENVLNLGISSGVTKPSTGYTFSRIQRQCRQIAESLTTKGRPILSNPSPLRFRIYDLMLLQIIHDHPDDAVKAFDQLFRYNNFDTLLQFLDEKTSLGEEMKIFTTVPYIPFLRAFFKTKGLIWGTLTSREHPDSL